MKLFRDKNRGPKIKSEDVVIPEEYLEYEREAEARKRREAEAKEERQQSLSAETESADADDPFAARVEQLLSTSKKTLQERAAEKEKPAPDVTLGEVVETLEDMLPDAEPTAKADDEPMSLEEALRIEKERSSRSARKARRQTTKKKDRQPGREKAAAEKKDDDLPLGFKVVLVCIVLVVATVVVLLGPLMKIDAVQVNDLENMTAAQVEEIAGNPIGQNLFFYRTSKAEEELRYYPYVQDVTITRHFPHWIEINVTEREPAGILLNNGSYLQFSKDGVLLDNAKTLTNHSLPLITGFSMDEVPSPGGTFKDNERFSDILKIVNACPDDLLTMIQEINIKDRNNILAYTSQGIEVRIGSVDNIEARMAILNDIMNQVILSNLIEDPIEAIDIRYEKSPVVVLEGYDNIDVTEYLDEDEDSTTNSSGTSADADSTDAASDSSNEDDQSTGTGTGQSTGNSTGNDSASTQTNDSSSNTGNGVTE